MVVSHVSRIVNKSAQNASKYTILKQSKKKLWVGDTPPHAPSLLIVAAVALDLGGQGRRIISTGVVPMGRGGRAPTYFQNITKYFCLKSSLHRFWIRGIYPMRRSRVFFTDYLAVSRASGAPSGRVCKSVKIMKID